MFDDLDDLLDDIPTNKSKPSTGNSGNKAPALSGLSKAKSAFPSTKQRKDDDDDFDWGGDNQKSSNNNLATSSQLSFGLSKRVGSAIGERKDSITNPPLPQNTRIQSSATFGKDSRLAKKEDDDWGGMLDDWTEGNKSRVSGNGGAAAGSTSKPMYGISKDTRDDGRSSMGSNYAGFGILGKPKPASSGKKKDDDDDLLDNILGDIEEKKGIDNTKKSSYQNDQDLFGGGGSNTRARSNTAGGTGFGFGGASKKQGAADAWGRDTFDDLDDMDDKPTAGAAALSNKMSADKRKALFGVGGSGTDDNKIPAYDPTSSNNNQRKGRFQQLNQQPQNNLADLEVKPQNTSKSMGRLGGANSHTNYNNGGDDYDYNDNGSAYNSQDHNNFGNAGGFNAYPGAGVFGGTVSNASGQQESQIDVIETPFSRSRTQRRTAAGGPPTGRQANSLQRPQTGNNDFGTFGGNSVNNQPQLNFDRVQTSPVGNMYNQQPINQFGGAQNQLQRPGTGNYSGKPPKKANINHQNNDLMSGGGFGSGDDNILDLLGESKDRGSHRGSQNSMIGGNNRNKMKGSLENDDEDESEYEEEEDEDGDHDDDEDEDDSDDFGGYVPSAIGNVVSAKKSAKKSKKKKKTNQKLENSGTGKQAFKSQVSAANSINNDLNNSNEKRGGYGNTNNSDIGEGTNFRGGYQMSQNSNYKNQNQTPFLGGGNRNSSTGSVKGGIQKQNSPQKQAPLPPPPDEITLLKRQIEEERQKQKTEEYRQRQGTDEVREDHKKNMKHLEEKHSLKLSLYNEEKRKLIEEMNKTIELEKEKFGNLHKIDVDNREVQYKRNLENQKRQYEDTHDTLKKQLEQQVQLNTFAQEISSSSGNINQLVQKLSSEKEQELKRREEALLQRDILLQERRKKHAEKKAQIEMRRKKLNIDMDDVQQRNQEQRLIYEKEKSDILNDIDKIDSEHQQQVRESRNKQIEMEVDTRRTKAEREKLIVFSDQETKESQQRMEELATMKKKYQHQKEEFQSEAEQQEKDLRMRLRDAKQLQLDAAEDEREFTLKENEYEQQNKQVMLDNEKLKEHLDKYCIDRGNFDRDAMRVKEQAERDQIDSEKIGFFKANKERLLDDLRRLREELENERDSIKEDRVKIELFKNDIKTRQKTIEALRFEFIKNNQDNAVQFLDDAKDIGFYKIQRYAGGPSFYPINPPSNYEPRKENMSPNTKYEQARHIVEKAKVSINIQDSAPRFNYEDYMSKLRDRLNLNGGGATQKVGTTDFQIYIQREREAYMKSLHEFENDQPLIQSLSQFRRSHAVDLDHHADNHDASFNLGSLQNSVHDKKRMTVGNGMLNSQMGKSSGNSLHFISKNFSTSPVEEVGRDQEESRLHVL